MGSLHLYLPFSMEYRARAPSIRFRLLPTLRTFHLLVPPISMLQQHLPQHLSHQLPPLLRQLARDLIKTRFRMLFPPIPHRLKHLLRTTHKLRLRLFSFRLIPLFLFSTFLLPPVYLPSASQKIWDAPVNRVHHRFGVGIVWRGIGARGGWNCLVSLGETQCGGQARPYGGVRQLGRVRGQAHGRHIGGSDGTGGTL